ncbi:MAG: Septum site-determining protein MinD [Syntrophorhabdus sp. PtaU1.Bin058]|nr:MAG: Septum site-determining protein MinD [Syntrophorhabdus sp. PtaU1.Bin058]
MDPRLHIIDKRLQDIKRIIAVSGGKGGTGKSSVASVLALALAKEGYRTGLLDLDFGGPSAHVILGVEGLFPEEDKGLIPPDASGIRFMSIIYFTGDNPAPLRGKEISNAIIELLAVTLWGELDFLIIDMPPGMADTALDVIRLIKRMEFILVTTPSKLATEVTKRELAILQELRLPVLGLIENMLTGQRAGTAAKVAGDRTAFLGSIDFDSTLEHAIGDVDKLLQTGFAKQLSLCHPFK